MRRGLLLGGLIGIFLLLAEAVPQLQPFNTQIQIAINSLTTGVIPFSRLRMATSAYINWGSGTDVNGYGFRDSGGVIETKNSGGGWVPVQSGAGAPSNASFITRVSEAGLTNETALSGLATALLQNTTGTGVLSAYAGTSCTNQYLNALSAVGAGTCATINLLTETSGTLTVARGGTGLTTGTSGGILGFTAAGTLASSGALTASAIVLGGGAGATPTVLGSLGTTTTVLHGNGAGAPSFGAVVLTTDVSGILGSSNGGTGNAFFALSGPAASIKTYTLPNASTTILTTNAAVTAVQGGTGQTVYVVGDLLQANTTTTLARLAAVSTGNALISGGVGVVSSWGKIGLTTHVTGTLPVTNGGTGLASYTIGDLITATAGTTLAPIADVAVNSFLRSGGVGVIPAWSTTKWTNSATTGDLLYASASNTYSNLAAVAAGSFLRSAGVTTAPVWSTTTWPNAATTGDLLAASGANTYANITAVATGRVLISQGVTTLPAWSTALAISTINIGANLTFSSTAPTVNSGFGAGVAITGTATAFRITVGTTPGNTGVLNMPTATTGWNCAADNLTASAAARAELTAETASTTTTVTLVNQTHGTRAATNWTNNDVVWVNCAAF